MLPIQVSKNEWNQIWNKTNLNSPNDTLIYQISKLNIRNVLEIGAGSGRDVEALTEENISALYSDFSDIAIKKFNIRNPDIRAVQCDSVNLPFIDNSFDLVYCLGLLEHFDINNRQKIINEMIRVSNKFIIIDVPQKYSLFTLVKKSLMLVKKWKYGNEIEFTCSELIKEVDAPNKTIALTKYGRGLFPLPRNFRDTVYKLFIGSKTKAMYLKIQEKLFWGFNSIGVVFIKNF